MHSNRRADFQIRPASVHNPTPRQRQVGLGSPSHSPALLPRVPHVCHSDAHDFREWQETSSACPAAACARWRTWPFVWDRRSKPFRIRTPCPWRGFFPEQSSASAERPANQVGLLWAFALLVAHSEHDGTGHGHPGSGGRSAETIASRTTLRACRRDVLATIDRACACSPRVREVVAELNGLLVPTNMQVMLHEASARGCGHHPWVYLLENLWASVDAGLRRRHGGYLARRNRL